MSRMLMVAWREFASVVFTRGFLLGVLLPPIFTGIAIGAVALMKMLPAPRAVGRIALIDHTGVTAPRAVSAFSAERVGAERAERQAKVAQAIDQQAARFNLPPEQREQAASMAKSQVDQALAEPTDLTLEVLAPDADLAALKESLKATRIVAKSDQTAADSNPLLAIAVIPPEAIKADADGRFGKFDLFVASKLDVQIQGTIERRLGGAIVDTRVALDPRVTGAGLSIKDLRALLDRPDVQPVTVSSSGERKSIGELQILVPMGFMLLMMISVMTTGGYLMTTVVEEKSNRVMEVLLSAVSPFQLMCGKVLGHMCVGALIISIYGGLGVSGLIYFALSQLVSPLMLVLLVCYFLIASTTMAAMMAAIGSAVNELREAQTLQTPVIMLVMLPWMIWFVIQRAPNSILAVTLSFVPGISPFVMVLRMAGSEPIPLWQHPVAIAIGIATALASLWASAKIFRIGVLMYGKPPNFATLVKWVRMA